jgi:hypothetical protein
MTIKPVPSGPTPRPGSGRPVDATAKSPDTRVEGEARGRTRDEAAPAKDNVELSAAALELQGQAGAGEVPSGELSKERLNQVLDRLASGHYDRPEVRDETAERAGEDLDQG